MGCDGCVLLAKLKEIVQFYSEADQRMKVEEACESLLIAKAAEGLSPRYLVGLRQTLHQFTRDHQGRPIASLTAAVVERWLATRREAPSSRRSTMGRLASLFTHLHKRGLIPENPMNRLTIPRVRRKPPRILAPDECRELLETCRSKVPDLLSFIVLGVFCGIRPFEALDMSWDDVDLRRGILRVDRTKTGKRRIVPLEPAAAAWLAVCHRSSLCPSWSTIRRRRRALWPDWSQDVLRHTAASYLLALHQDAGKVAFWLGNSPRILMEHYSELVDPDACGAFWSQRPEDAVPAQ